MKSSELFGKTLKEAPKDVESRSASLLLRGGFIDQTGTGLYTFLPLGYRVLDKVISVIREEINKIGGQELLMPALHPSAFWKTTGRYDLPVGFRTKSRTGQEYVLGWTHEEIITPLAKKFINSYKDLPVFLYQFQTKFRDEERAKSGLLRTREFVMKDLYSFHTDIDDLDKYYEKAKQAYQNIYKKLGIGDRTLVTYASGGEFSEFSHEFQTLTEAGEDTIFVCPKCHLAINKEIIDKIDSCPECHSKELEEKKAVEVGNIFKLGEKYSKAFDVKYLDKDGNHNSVVMGCYGIGPGRAIGTIAEVLSDDKGLVWPVEIAPYQVYLVAIGDEGRLEADKIYDDLMTDNIEILYDDTDDSAGAKFARADLLGIPYRVVVSDKSLGEGGLEFKERVGDNPEIIRVEELKKRVKNG